MIKRLFCLLLCLLALAPAARGETLGDIDIPTLIARQVSAKSTLRMQLTAEVSEKAPFFADAALWPVLTSGLPGLTLEGSYVFSRAGQTLGDTQLALRLKRNGETRSTLRLNGREQQWQIWGDALEDNVLILPRDTELLLRGRYVSLAQWMGAILRNGALLKQVMEGARAGDWPDPGLIALESATAEEAWRQAVDKEIEKYTAQISAWMQGKATLRVERSENGESVTVSELRASMADCGAEALALLRMFYADEALLALLRQHMTREQEEAYLEDGMLPLFEEALQAAAEDKELVLLRRYTADGQLLDMQISMPLAGDVACAVTAAGNAYTLWVEWPGRTLTLTAQGDMLTGWQGAFSWTAGERTLSGSYQLVGTQGQSYNDEDASGRTHRQDSLYTLMIIPDAGMPFPAQTLTAQINAWTATDTTRTPAYWNVDMNWQQADGAYIHALLRLRTDSTIHQTEAEGNPIELATAPESLRAAILQQALLHWMGVIWDESIDSIKNTMLQ